MSTMSNKNGTTKKNEQDDEHFQLKKVFLAFSGLPRVLSIVWSADEQFTITVAGRDLDGALTENGIYMSVPSICRALEIEHKTQIRRIKRNRRLLTHLRQLMLPSIGGLQATTCVAVEVVSEWLQSIQVDIIAEQCRERLLFYQQNLSSIIKTMIPVSGEVSQISAASNSLIIVEEKYIASTGEDEPGEIRHDIFADIPKVQETTLVHTHLFDEDTAIRESYLAGLPHWQKDKETEKRPFYIASNQLEVYLSNPSQPIELSVALQRIGQLSMRTVITGRIAFWLWNLRRNDPRCSADGWTALHVEEILQLRGVSMHSRTVTSGSDVRKSDGYFEEKYREQAYQDFQLLNDSYIRRYVTVAGEDQVERTYYNEWPYLHVNFMMERLSEGDQVVAIAIKPGEWMPRELREAFHRFAEIDKRIFQLNQKTDQHTIFLALYLVERWRHQVQQAIKNGKENDTDPRFPYREPIRMRDLLAASIIAIDWPHLTARFADRIESALDKLYEKGILCEKPYRLTFIDKNRNWGNAWLDAYWQLFPSLGKSPEEVYQLTLLGDVVETKLLKAPKRNV